MNRLIIRIYIPLLLSISAFVTGCFMSSDPRDSSGSNWLICQTLDDCYSDVAMSCSDDGYCLDEDGERIAQTAVDAEIESEPDPEPDAGDAMVDIEVDAMVKVDADQTDAQKMGDDASVPEPPSNPDPPSEALCAWGVSDILAEASLSIPDRINCGEYNSSIITTGADCFFDAINAGQAAQLTVNYCEDCNIPTTYIASADGEYYAVLMEDDYFGDDLREAKLERCGKLERVVPQSNEDEWEDITCTAREELYQCTELRSIARAYKVGDVPANGAETTTLHLYLSNQSFDNPIAQFEVFIEETEVVRGAFDVKGQHNWIPFDIEVPVGTLSLRAHSSYAGAEFQKQIEVPAERWAVVNYSYTHDETGEDFSGEESFDFMIQDNPVAFQ